MTDVAILTVGDKSDHGGQIISGDPIVKINNKPVARLGDLHNCPQVYPNGVPHGTTPIVMKQNVPNRMIVNGRLAAVEGDMAGCGCTLMSSNVNMTKCIALGAIAVSVLALGAAFLLNRNKYSLNIGNVSDGSGKFNITNNLTNEQNAILNTKVLQYQNFAKKYAYVPSQSQTVVNESNNPDCNCN